MPPLPSEQRVAAAMAEAVVQWGMPETGREGQKGPQEPRGGEETEPCPADAGQALTGAGTVLQVSRQWEY